MLECRVDQIRGKDIQSGITVRNRFNWTVKSVQTYSRHGYKNDATITQVVYERQDEYPFQAELEPLEEVANGLKYPNPKPVLRRLIAMLVFTAIFGILWFMYPTLEALPFLAFLAGLTFIPLVLLGITGIFGVLSLVFLISSIVRSAINHKSMKKRKMIMEAARRIQKGLPMEFSFKKKKHKKSDEPVAPKVVPAPVVQPAPHPVQPAPVVHPVVQPMPVQPTPQPVPHPVQPAPHPAQPMPQPVFQPAPHPVQPVPQPVVQPAPHPVQPVPQPVVQPAPHPVQPVPQPVVQPAPVQPVTPPVQPVTPPVQPAPTQPAPAKPIEPTVVKPVDPNAE